MLRILFAACGLILLLGSDKASAWDYQGHRVIGSIADELLLNTNTGKKVTEILNDGNADGKLTLQLVAPWADCVRAVRRKDDGTFAYEPKADHPEYELPCLPFTSVKAEKDRLIDYASRNFCGVSPGCHTNYHFNDVAIQRDRFERGVPGTGKQDLVAAIGAAVAKLRGDPVPEPFKIEDTKVALMLLAHFVGDLHQPLHVGAIYLDATGKPIDPGQHADSDTKTHGGNAIKNQNVDLHLQWDDIPFDLGDARTRELMAAARAVPSSEGTSDKWPTNWATDSIVTARQAFAGLRFGERIVPPPSVPPQFPYWTVSFEVPEAYLLMSDAIKRRQLAKGGARLAEILRDIWQ